LTIAIAPTKNIERFEWFLEKATEIGVDRIIPVVCKQSERQIIKPERLIKILIEAIKQSGQAYLPQLQELTGFDNFIKQNTDDKMLIAFCTEDQKRLLKSVINPGENITILIGPEGDFTREEIKVAFDSGYTGISLGQNRLRTETAGVVAAHTVALVNQLG
jgi:16S rRNA (uracil1498-N3)-methyltransferase